MMAIPAQNRLFSPLLAWPFGWGMSGLFMVAIVTRIILFAAMKFNGNDIPITLIMGTTGLCVNLHPFNKRMLRQSHPSNYFIIYLTYSNMDWIPNIRCTRSPILWNIVHHSFLYSGRQRNRNTNKAVTLSTPGHW